MNWAQLREQDVLKGWGTLNVRVSDSFGPNFLANTVGKRESRIGFIGYSYRLSRKIVNVRDNEERASDSSPEEGDF